MELRQVVALSTVLAFLAATLGAPALVRAAGPDPSTVQEARTHYQTGQAAYASGDYVTAIKEWKRADEIAPAVALNYNIGLAYEKLGRYKAAAKYYNVYLTGEPSAPNKAEVEDRLAACQAAGDAADAAEAAPPAAEVVAPPSPTPAAPTDATSTAAPVPPPSASSAPPPPPGGGEYGTPGEAQADNAPGAQPAVVQQDDPVYSHWWFWAILGGGALVLIVSAVHDSNHQALSGAVPAPNSPGLSLFNF